MVRRDLRQLTFRLANIGAWMVGLAIVIYLCMVGATILTPNDGWVVHRDMFDRQGTDLRRPFAALGVAVTVVAAALATLTADRLRHRGVGAAQRRLTTLGIVIITLAVMFAWLALHVVSNRAY